MKQKDIAIAIVFAVICSIVVFIFFGQPYHGEETPMPSPCPSPTPVPIDPRQNVDITQRVPDDVLEVAAKDLFARYDKPARYTIYLEWDHALSSASESDVKTIRVPIMGRYDISNLQLLIIKKEGM